MNISDVTHKGLTSGISTTTVLGRKTNYDMYLLIQQYYNPKLVRETDFVHHIFNDGTITRTKAGSIYGWRSEHTEFDPRKPGEHVELKELGFSFSRHMFPIERQGRDEKFGYAIVTLEDAMKIRDVMLKIKQEYDINKI